MRRGPNNFQKILERRFQKLRARVYKRNKRIGSVRHEAEDIKGSGKLQWSREKSVRETRLSPVLLCPGRRSSCKMRSNGVAYGCSLLSSATILAYCRY